jgi:NAD(P)-dependent dehydrogenase (short-subunit alcohol dehydrogenase family)
MKEHGGGRIVNIGSGCNKIPFPNLVSYTASKGGIELFTRVSAVELGKYGITVNCVAPGAIDRAHETGGRLRRSGQPDAWARRHASRRRSCGRVSPGRKRRSSRSTIGDGGLFTRAPWAY